MYLQYFCISLSYLCNRVTLLKNRNTEEKQTVREFILFQFPCLSLSVPSVFTVGTEQITNVSHDRDNYEKSPAFQGLKIQHSFEIDQNTSI